MDKKQENVELEKNRNLVKLLQAQKEKEVKLLKRISDLEKRLKALEKTENGRKRIEDPFVINETLFRAVAEQTGDGISLADIDGNYIFVNPAFCQISGYTQAELLEMKVFDLVSPGIDIEIFPKTVRRQSGKREVELLKKNGSKFVAEVAGYPIDLENRTLIIGIVRDITARRKIEDALRESNSFNSSLLEHSPVSILVYSPDTTILYINPFFEELTGFTIKEVCGLKAPYPWWVDEPEYGTVEQRKKLMLEGINRAERRFKKKNGEYSWVELNIVPIHHDGKLSYSLSMWVDISERKEKEKNLQLAGKIAKIGYWSRKLDSNEIIWSGETCRIFGLELTVTATSFTTVDLLEHIHPEDRKMMRQAIQDSIEGIHSHDLEYRALRPDGTVRWIHSKGEVDFDEHGQSRRLFGIVQDITERKRAEEAKKESEEKFRRLTENSPDMIYRMSLPDGEYEYVSPAATTIFGYSPQTWYDNPMLIREAIHTDWRSYFEEQWKNLIKGSVPKTYEYQIVHKNGSVRWLNQRNILVAREDGQLIAIEGIVTDITARKETEKAIQRYIDRLEILREMDHAILTIRPPIDIAKIALKHLRKLILCIRASVVTFDKNLTEASLLVADSENETKIDRDMKAPISLFGNTEDFKNGKINRIDDLAAVSMKSQNIQTLRNEGIQSYINYPIITGGKLIGALNIGFDKPGAFTDQYLEIVSEIALSLGIAIHNGQLIEEIRSHQQELERYSSRLITIQERERKRISMELHDEVGQALTAISINLASIQKAVSPEMPDAVHEKLKNTRLLTDHTIDQIHDLSLLLRPSILDDLGLVPALRWFIDSYSQRCNIEVIFKADKIINNLNETVKITIYRVLQEALNNTAKHAEATKVTVRLKQRKSGIAVIIEDNGRGFNVGDVLVKNPGKYGIGIIGMHERVYLINGNLDIESGTGHGTRIKMEIPFYGDKVA